MDAIDAILSRRSIREYKDKDVSDEIIKKLLQAAMAAPSAMNQQVWRFVVIRDKKILNSIPDIQPYSDMLREAPLAIVVSADISKEKAKGFWVQDCSAATENILLASHALGLGAVWLGFYPREDRCNALSKILGLPEDHKILSVISIGYPSEEKRASERYDESKVRYA